MSWVVDVAFFGVCCNEDQPRQWKDADLLSLKSFLNAEIAAGRYVPQEGMPFD